MSDLQNGNGGKAPKKNSGRRIRLSDGTYAVYMGETGEKEKKLRRERKNTSSGNARITEGERRQLEERRREEYERRKRRQAARASSGTSSKAKKENNIFRIIFDRIYMWWMGIAIDVADIVKGAVVGALMLFFAMLQTTVLSQIRPFGATPDLMLAFVCAVAVGEGEKWGSVTALISALFIEALGSVGLTLLPLVYVPAAFAIGILSTYYMRDSFIMRAVYTTAACIPKAVLTMVNVYVTYENVKVGTMLADIVIPELLSTALMAVFVHIIVYFSLKFFHKTRSERVGKN